MWKIPLIFFLKPPLMSGSKSALMSPTLVAATATIMKVPYFHLPYQATLSLVTTQLGISLTMEGETEKRVPGKCLLMETFQSVGEWNLNKAIEILPHLSSLGHLW